MNTAPKFAHYIFTRYRITQRLQKHKKIKNIIIQYANLRAVFICYAKEVASLATKR